MSDLIPYDWICEQSATSGTADFELNGPVQGARAFGDKFADGQRAVYVAQFFNGSAWEKEGGLGTYIAGTNTLQRTEISESTNGNAKVNFSGPPTILCTIPVRMANRVLGIEYYAGLRNRIINGSFDVVQRGASVVITGGSPGYAMDQWRVSASSGLTCTADRVAHTIGTMRARFFGQFAFTGTGSSGSYVSQRLERVSTLANRQVTVAFGIMANTTQDVNVVLRQNFGSGGSPSTSVDTPVATVSAGTGWTRYKRTIILPSIAGKTLGTSGDFLELLFVLTQANAQTISLDRVCVVDGDATREDDVWEDRHLAVDWLLCRRFYWRGGPTSGWPLNYASGAGTGWVGPSGSFGVPMRATPSGSIITAPTYLNCTDGGLNMNINGWVHLLDPSGAGVYRAIGGVYAMSAEL